jgi:succinate-acetate transporter protein
MSTVHASQSVDAGRGEPLLVEPEVMAKPSGWANSGPLCLIAFAAVTFMISLVNAKGVSNAVVPMVISTGLIFGGATQLVGGLIQIRTGNTLNGALFSTFGGFWVVLAAYLEWFSKAVPAAQAGHATGLLLYTFAIIAAMFLLVSFRTTIASMLALTNLVATLLLLAAGNYGGHATLLHIGGVTGMILAGQALYMAAAEISEYAYGESVLPLGKLGK